MKKILSRTMALMLTAALLVSSTACGSAPSSTATAPTPAPAAPAASTATGTSEPAKAVEQTLYLTGSDEGIGDKTVYPWKNMRFDGSLLYRTLFMAETDLTTVKPDLAKSHTVSEDGLTYTFEIVDNAKWSDGEPITANDVAFSIRSALKVAICNAIFTNPFGKIVGAQDWKDSKATDLAGVKVDGNKVIVTLADPYAAFIPTMAQFAILPEHKLKDADMLELYNNTAYWSNPVTSGPFKVGEMNVGNFYTLVPNENYNGGPAPKITKVVQYFNNDYVTQAQAGKVDVLNTNAPDVISELKKLDTMTMFPVDILFYRYFLVNMKGVDGNQNAAMQDVRVRQAILHAIDRAELAKSMFPDLGTVINSGVANSAAEYNKVEFEYNPEKAKTLLKEAGYDMSRPIRILYYYTDQASVDFMDALAYYLSEVGLKTEIIQSSSGTQDLFKTRNYDIGYKGLSAFDISEWYGEYSSSNANFKNVFGGDTIFDKLSSQLTATSDPAKRSELLKELQKLEQENLYKLPFFTLGNNMFINTKHVKLPNGIVFGNPWYKTNIGFENWEIIG